MPKLSAFPKCYMDELCVTKTMTLFDWIDLAATLGEDSDTLEDVYEPYLIQRGFIQRTPRGRMATPAAYAHVKRTMPAGGQLSLPIDMESGAE